MIDTKRLATDAAYWLDSDPSDGEATHFEPIYSDHECAWVRVDRKGLRHYFYNGGWVCADNTSDDIGPLGSMIPRPQSEWVDGLPKMAIMVNPHEAPLQYGEDHLGREVEVIEWLPDESCYVVRFDWGLGVLHDSMVDFGLHKVRTKEERDREELCGIASKYSDLGRVIADEIIAAGWTKP